MIYHHWEKWECVTAGMYETIPPSPYTPDDAITAYAIFLRDLPRFEAALDRVLTEWPISCEQFLSNVNLNRIAWLGQASMCIATGIPSSFRAGFKLLTDAEQSAANAMAAKWLLKWERDAKANRRLHREMETARLSNRHPRRSSAGVNALKSSALIQGDLFSYPSE